MTFSNLLFSYWHFNIPAFIIAVILIYFHYRTNGSTFTRKSYLFLSGIILFVLATFSPIDYLGHGYLFAAHMTEHIMLLLIIPPLLLSGTSAVYLSKVVNKAWFKKIGNFLFVPFVAWLIGVGSMWVWHDPYIFELTKASQFLQIINMVSLLIMGVIFIWPVFTPVNFKKLSPLQSALYLFFACVGCTVLGILITFAPEGLYTSLMSGTDLTLLRYLQTNLGITPSIDQQMGGLIMWVPACIVYLTNILIGILNWYKYSE